MTSWLLISEDWHAVPEPLETGEPGITVSGELPPDEIFEEVLRRLGIERPRWPER